MPRILRTTSAQRDIDELWDYIALVKQSPGAADRLVDRLDEVLRLILQQPAMGERVDHLRPNTRRFVVANNYLIFYDSVGDDLRVLRVLHGAMMIRPGEFEAVSD